MSMSVRFVSPEDAEIEKLLIAAEAGDINKLYQIIASQPGILEYLDQKSFCHTPLHAAAMAGQHLFAVEMMTRKPSLARKLNASGRSPLHVSLQKALKSTKDERKLHIRMVCQLVKANGDLVRVKGGYGYTPFLYAVLQNGDHDILLKFLAAQPECLNDVNTQGETALHIAVRSNNLEVFELLLKWLDNCDHYNRNMEEKILNWEDENGNTVMHLAASKYNNQTQFVEKLHGRHVDMNVKNLDGKTPMMILPESERWKWKIKETGPPRADIFNSALKSLINQDAIRSKGRNLSDGMLNALLVVICLVATSTYLAVLNLPNMPNSDNAADPQGNNGTHGLLANRFWILNSILLGMSLRGIWVLLPTDKGVFINFLFIVFIGCHWISVQSSKGSSNIDAIQTLVLGVITLCLYSLHLVRLLYRRR